MKSRTHQDSRNYEKPELIKHGNLKEITLVSNAAITKAFDGAFSPVNSD